MAASTLSTSCTLSTNFGIQVSTAAVKSPSSVSFVSHPSVTSGLKTFRKLGLAAMAVYKVKLVSPEGDVHEFEAQDDTYILDSAESAGVELGLALPALAKLRLALSISRMDHSSMMHSRLRDMFSPACPTRGPTV
ncbi:hypothetical protein PVAP13_2NG114400 [Panicum virgatum]|uniref:Uncharacterized protein n=1 Tax=Panicum virgatum TaxID=38727 RepID=A0A8T0VDW3_PANVG|nr:hypothetical protein PVAP13_2NG114400 [Panicum virgatum]